MPVAASVRREVGAAAVGTLVLVSAQQRRAADLDGVENLPVLRREPMLAGILRQAGAQHVGQPQRGRTRDRAPGRFWTTARHRRLVGGQLVDGTALNGPDTLRAALLSRFDVVARTLSEKLLTYGLGRAMRPTDMPSVRAITRDAAKDNYKFSSLILGVVSSETFQMRRKSAAN